MLFILQISLPADTGDLASLSIFKGRLENNLKEFYWKHLDELH